MTFFGTLLAVFLVILFTAGERIAKRKRDERIAKMFRDERIAKMKRDERIAKMTGLQAHRLKLEMMRHNASAPDGEKQSCPAWLESFPDSNSPVVGCDCFVCKTLAVAATRSILGVRCRCCDALFYADHRGKIHADHPRNCFTRDDCKLDDLRLLDSASPCDFARLGLSLLSLARTERMARYDVDQKKKLADKAQTLLAHSRSLGGQ